MSRFRSAVSGLLLGAAMLTAAPAIAGPVNVNTADARTLSKELAGVGPAKAQAIVAWREKNGPFKSLEEIARVKGVGKKLVERNKANLRLDGKAQAEEPAAKAGGG